MSVLNVEDRHHSVRWSLKDNEEENTEIINKLIERISNIKGLRYGLIGEVENSEVKGLHIHICMSYNSVKKGKNVLKDLGIKDRYHIRPIYRLKYGDQQECVFDDGRKSFYGYAKKNGMLFEFGEPCKDKINNKDGDNNDDDNIGEEENSKEEILRKLKMILEKNGGKIIELNEEEKEEKKLVSKLETSMRREYVIARLKTFGGMFLFDTWIRKMGLDGMKDLNILVKRHYCCDSNKIKKRGGNPYVECKNIQIFDNSGTLKTTTVKNWATMMGYRVYEKSKTSKFFDGYTDQEVMLINEINREEFGILGGGDAIKPWLDRDPFPIEKKHLSQDMIRPEYVIFTSNVDLIETGIEYYNGLHPPMKNVGKNWTDPMKNRIRIWNLEQFCRHFSIKTNSKVNDEGKVIWSETVKHEWNKNEHMERRTPLKQAWDTIDRLAEVIDQQAELINTLENDKEELIDMYTTYDN